MCIIQFGYSAVNISVNSIILETCKCRNNFAIGSEYLNEFSINCYCDLAAEGEATDVKSWIESPW